MAYRRRQQQVILTPSAGAYNLVDAAKAIRASSAHKDSSFSSAYAYGSLHSSSASPLSTSKVIPPSPHFLPGVPILIAIIFLGTLETLSSIACLPHQDFHSHQYASMKSLNESKQGFWGSLSRKAKSFLDDDNNVQKQFESDGPVA